MPFQKPFARKAQNRFDAAIAEMNTPVDDIIAKRRARPDPDAKDLINLMLTAVDPGRAAGGSQHPLSGADFPDRRA